MEVEKRSMRRIRERWMAASLHGLSRKIVIYLLCGPRIAHRYTERKQKKKDRKEERN
jgi:hypothetical protein